MNPDIQALPDDLHASLTTAWADFVEAVSAQQLQLPAAGAWLQSLPKVWAASDFISHACRRHPGMLLALLQDGQLAAQAAPLQIDAAEEASLMRQLREYRRAEMVRIGWRDIADVDELPITLAALTALAEVTLEAALDWLDAELQRRHGVPRSRESGEPQQIIVLGMGKLGGGELNYSSDIDIILSWPEPGSTDGERPLNNEEYFIKLARGLVRVLDTVTEDGFVFRVDTRLRPFGNSGPMAMHAERIRDYYQEHGRDWERYALVKARPVAGDIAGGNALLRSLRPFIYRRYLDFTAFEGLRRMKDMINAELRRKNIANNVKIGRGGIREVEFVAQVYQLVRGGQERNLRQRELLPTLTELKRCGHLSIPVSDELRDAYIFLRRLENRLQQYRDAQTHVLPKDTDQQQRLAVGMGIDGWDALAAEYEHWRSIVHGHFQRIFASDEDEEADAECVTAWSDAESSPDEVRDELAALGFEPAENLAQRMVALHKGNLYASLNETSRARWDRLLPNVLEAALEGENPAVAAERVLSVLEAIGRRDTYIALLLERPTALEQLLRLCAASPWITQRIATHPALLDELLDPRALYDLRDRAALQAELSEQLGLVEPEDEEQLLDTLRQFKNIEVLHTAAVDLTGGLDIMKVSDRLTEIAEVLVQAVLDLAWTQLTGRFGTPGYVVDDQRQPSGFAVVAYGKLGGRELGYGSDLDVVFLHNSCGSQQQTDGERCIENGVFFARLAQRILHLLGTVTRSGRLYEVDTRLRPSGRSGLLVASTEAFADYQAKQAWTWEHQALIRARTVATAPLEQGALVAASFDAIRRQILAQPRDAIALRGEVASMRQKMRENLDTSTAEVFDIKQAAGGITDMEFVVQYAVLRDAVENPALLAHTDNIRLLGALSGNLLTPAEAEAMVDAYRELRKRAHVQALAEQAGQLPLDQCAEHRAAVQAVWQRLGLDEVASE